MAADGQLVQVGDRRLRVTNLDKVVYPATGTPKGEVIAYYTRIAPLLLPQLAGRPVTRKRWVDGVGTADAPAESFFTKQLERGAPEWIPRQAIQHSDGPKEYPLVNDVPTLVWLAQVASLELHVPQWRFTPEGLPGLPDRLVLDLDPGPGVELAQCAEVALMARELLLGMGLDPVPVTSGSKGIHLYAALPGAQTSDEISAVVKELARIIETEHPDLATSVMAKAARGGKVFLDWSQNNGKKTTISPYSLRGRAQPWVAAPRTWDELEAPGLRHLDLHEVLDRMAAGLDPLAGLGAYNHALVPYLAKRDAARTPEPMPDRVAPSSAGMTRRFVIQEHHARRLHYDLRIEDAGVLVSWAVPKGVPETADRNHLAVMTEPHPMEYLTFAGSIPKGEYGAGEMTVWDTGTVELEKWRDSEVIGTFTGRDGGPLGVAHLALIRTGGEGEKSSWLLHRMKDRAEPAGAKVSAPQRSRKAPRTRAAAVSAPARSASASVASAPASPPVDTVRPMLAEHGTPAAARRLSSPGWAEIKWDGIRVIGVWRDGRMTLQARSGIDITARYPELTADGAPGFAVDDLVVDGEITAFDDSGRPSFARLQSRIHLTAAREIEREVVRNPVTYYLFDLLRLDGHDLTALPLRDRRELLEGIVQGLDAPIVVPPVFDDVDAALQTSAELGLEGVVVKDPASTYRPGQRSASWLKLKHTRTQEVVVGGIRPGKGDRHGRIGSLLLGVPGPEGLRYVGRVGTGFTERMLRDLTARLDPLRTDQSPFLNVPRPDASDALWVRPEVVAEVEFANWTPDGILRHARWRGLRLDKDPSEVAQEP